MRAFTARGNPLLFEVVVVPPREAEFSSENPATADRNLARPATVSRQDGVLATGFEELVGDLEAGSPPPPVRSPEGPTPPGPVAEEPTTLCRARLSWPPADGEHRLTCGASLLVVETRRVSGRR